MEEYTTCDTALSIPGSLSKYITTYGATSKIDNKNYYNTGLLKIQQLIPNIMKYKYILFREMIVTLFALKESA